MKQQKKIKLRNKTFMKDNNKRTDSSNDNYVMANGDLSKAQGIKFIHKFLYKPQKDLFKFFWTCLLSS